MTTSISTETKNVIQIKLKGFFGGLDVDRSAGYDEDGIRHWTWWIEKNMCEDAQMAVVYRCFSAHNFADIIIDTDVVDEVSDSAILFLVSRLRRVA
jgi:hypothetical protein